MSGAPRLAVVGAGPAGLFAAERLAEAGAAVTVYDRMASPARKLLLAGRGGLNLTHTEPRAAFLARYREAGGRLAPMLDAFPPSALRAWAAGLGQPTFVGSSGRVFPEAFKASPLVRAWLRRLDRLGVRLVMRRRLVGLAAGGALQLEGPEGTETVQADAVLLALGGASWPRMGSDGAWAGILEGLGVAVVPLAPANMGVGIAWTPDFSARFAGQPLKRITVRCGDEAAGGEAVITAQGLEGGAIYALSAALRQAAGSNSPLVIDLKPDLAVETVARRLSAARPKDSLSSVLRKALGLPPQAAGLLRQASGSPPREAAPLAALVKAVPLAAAGVGPLERAISSAGGIALDAVDNGLQLIGRPGLFVAGEMLDWEAPTGGYLLQATFATAEAAARGIAARLGLCLAPPAAAGW